LFKKNYKNFFFFLILNLPGWQQPKFQPPPPPPPEIYRPGRMELKICSLEKACGCDSAAYKICRCSPKFSL
jgi:hypothetical protein